MNFMNDFIGLLCGLMIGMNLGIMVMHHFIVMPMRKTLDAAFEGWRESNDGWRESIEIRLQNTGLKSPIQVDSL